MVIDQNLFKGFDYNNKLNHYNHQDCPREIVEGYPVKTTVIDQEDKRIKAMRNQPRLFPDPRLSLQESPLPTLSKRQKTDETPKVVNQICVGINNSNVD